VTESQDLVGPPPAWLTEAVAAVLGDLQQPTPVDLEVAYGRERWWDEDCWVVRVRETSGWSDAFVVDPETRGAFLLERFADRLQEYFFPESRGAWGEARPACPGHTHPARPCSDDATDTAWWYCPTTDRNIARIGHYGEAEHSS
jgi:hypothetical protein